jgi:DNA-binding HxlR family transcriptional regulator
MARDGAAGSSVTWTDPNCPVARAADVIGDRWSLLIVRDAMDGARSFTDFQQRTGIARNILADRLRKLVGHGLITQVEAPSGRRRGYALTAAGKDLFAVIVTLRQWGERHAFEAGEAHSVLVDDAGAVVPQVVPAATDGRPLTSDTTSVQREV